MFHEVVVLPGHHAGRIAPQLLDFPLTLERNPNPDAGQVSSLRLGLAALNPKPDVALVALAQQPLVSAQDITALIGACKKRGEASVLVPWRNTGAGCGPATR